jgi:hypothetical protein
MRKEITVYTCDYCGRDIQEPASNDEAKNIGSDAKGSDAKGWKGPAEVEVSEPEQRRRVFLHWDLCEVCANTVSIGEVMDKRRCIAKAGKP